MLELKLLGVPELFWQGKKLTLPSPKNLALLIYLACRNEACERRELLELFWRAGKPSNLRFALFKLREIEGADVWLETTDNFVSAHATTDISRIKTAVNENHFGKALSFWPQHTKAESCFLKGLELKDAPAFQNWLELERTRTGELYLELMQKAISCLAAEQKYDEALNLAYTLTEQDPLNENAHRNIMQLEHKRGNTEAALAQFERCRVFLKEELDLEPLEETLELLAEIEEGETSHSQRSRLLTSDHPLLPTNELFVGRETFLEDALNSLHIEQSLLLQGFGGVGKTALATIITMKLLENLKKALWLEVGDASPEVLFDLVAKRLNVQKEWHQAENKTAFIRKQLIKQQIDLVVLDDVWNAYTLSKLKEALPKRTKLLVTSRQRYPGIKRLELGALTVKDAFKTTKSSCSKRAGRRWLCGAAL